MFRCVSPLTHLFGESLLYDVVNWFLLQTTACEINFGGLVVQQTIHPLHTLGKLLLFIYNTDTCIHFSLSSLWYLQLCHIFEKDIYK